MRIKKVISASRGNLTVQTEDNQTIKRTGGTVSWRTNNPGNLKDGKFARAFGSIGKDHIGHAVFPTYDHGYQAKYNLLFSATSIYHNLTINQAIHRYAPISDGNKPDQYVAYLTKNTNINRDTKLCDLDESQRLALLDTMKIFEGYKIGNDIVLEG